MDQGRSNLTDREMLVLLADQNRRLEQAIDRLTTSIEARLAQGDRRFAEMDTRIIDSDRRHSATNTAINSLSGKAFDLERALKGEADARKGAEAKLESLTEEWETWKTRVQTVAWIVGPIWATVTLVWPFLPAIIRFVNSGGAP